MLPKRFRFGVLALCVVALCVCGIWVRSFSWCDLVGVNTAPSNSPSAKRPIPRVTGQPTGAFIGVVTQAGRLYIVRFHEWDSRFLHTGWNRNPIDDPDGSPLEMWARHRFAGFSIHWEFLETPGFFVGIPLWLPLAVCVIPLLISRLRIGLRRKRGRCDRCGYDLRATPGLCPECGNRA
jgi:hypothetical protein